MKRKGGEDEVMTRRKKLILETDNQSEITADIKDAKCKNAKTSSKIISQTKSTPSQTIFEQTNKGNVAPSL